MLSQKEFIKKAMEICRAVKFPDYEDDPKCEAAKALLKSEKVKAGDDDDAVDDLPELYPVATKKFRETMCAKFTRPRKIRVMRDSYTLAKSEVATS